MTENATTPSPRGLLDGSEAIGARIELGSDPEPDPGGDPTSRAAFRKLGSGLATFVALVIAAYLIPLPWAQPWRADEGYVPFWNLLGRGLVGVDGALAAEAEVLARVDALEQLVERELRPVVERAVIDRPQAVGLRFAPYEPHPLDPLSKDVVLALEYPEALDRVYAALTLTDIGYATAQTRVGHWGDSVIGNDGITSAIRQRMQARFGDAGHGFHALTKYDASYRHRGVEFEMVGDARWKACAIRNLCSDDAHYGYGGVTVWSRGGVHSRFSTVDKGPVGQRLSLFEVYYAKQPQGGSLRVLVDGVAHTIDTASASGALEDAWARFEVPDGPHTFEVRASGDGSVRAYGVVLERALPGVVWDGMALIGSFTKRLAAQDPEHLARQLGHRDLDLIVLSFGGNDMTRERSDLRRSIEPYEADYASVIMALRAAAPEASCLIVGPVDHGERVNGRVVSRGISARMSEAQRRVAQAHDCAFFDTFRAMGGPGSVAVWRARSLMSPDLAHPSPRGHQAIGAMLYAALVQGYIGYRGRHVGEIVLAERVRPGPLR